MKHHRENRGHKVLAHDADGKILWQSGAQLELALDTEEIPF